MQALSMHDSSDAGQPLARAASPKPKPKVTSAASTVMFSICKSM